MHGHCRQVAFYREIATETESKTGLNVYPWIEGGKAIELSEEEIEPLPELCQSKHVATKSPRNENSKCNGT